MSEHVVRPREMQILRRQVQDVRWQKCPHWLLRFRSLVEDAL